MKKLIYKLIENRKITLFFVCMLIAAGVLGYIENPKQESPDFSIPYALITTYYPGASQGDVDRYVTQPIEKDIQKISGYESSYSYSRNSLSVTILEFKFSADRSESFRELKESMSQLQNSLPENCGQINVNTNITDTAGIMLALSSDKLSNLEVVSSAQLVIDRLNEVEGFSAFEIIGQTETILSVQVDEDAMKSAGLSFNDLVALVEAGGLDIPIGEIKNETQTFTVDYIGGYRDIEDVKDISVGYSQELKKIITLSDIADIKYETASSNTYYSYNGNPAVIVAGYFQDGINTHALKGEIDDKLDEIQEELPQELTTALIISQPDEIDGSLIDFLKNLLLAVGLVILVVLLGMGVRNALVVSVSLPLSVLIALGVMSIVNIKIHQVSIAALIVSLGMLVDNSIVVSDSIQGYLDSGIKRKKACMKGVKDVAIPVLTSTITTVAAFMPFLFLNSIAGDYIQALPEIVSISLAASYITAIFIIPVFGFILFKPKTKKKKARSLDVFKKLLKTGMNHKTAVIFIVIILAASSAYLATNLATVFFPASDKDILYIDITNYDSDSTEGTLQIIEEISKLLESEAGITEYTASAGGGLPRFNQIMFVYSKSPDVGQIMMRVSLENTDYDINEEFKMYLQNKLDKLNLEAKVTVKELMYAYPMEEDIRIRIVGDDITSLKNYENQIYELLKDNGSLQNVSKSNTDYVEEYTVLIAEKAAAQYGLTPAAVQNEVSIALMGRSASVVSSDGFDADIIIKGDYTSYSDLLAIPIKNSLGGYTNARDIMLVTRSESMSSIPRYNGDYSLVVTADFILDSEKSETLNELKNEIEDLNIDDAKIIYDGEDEKIKENFGEVGVLGAIALVLVFIVLMIQFKSFAMPFLIFITIPLSAIGSIVGLFITGQPISFTALLGIVSLLGIVVNNAIILIDFIKKEQFNGAKIKKACLKASNRRLRPILLSTITTVIGLIPLALSNSELFKPMAIALMSGLLVSTLLTLVVLPVLVSMVAKDI